MKIVVTGAVGFIGSILMRRLLDDVHLGLPDPTILNSSEPEVMPHS